MGTMHMTGRRLFHLSVWLILVQILPGTAFPQSQNWASVINVTPSNEIANSPSIALSADGTKATAIWSRDDGVGGQVIYSSSATLNGNVANWGAIIPVNLSGSDTSSLQIALSADGTKATAVWVRSDGSNSRIQSASASVSGDTASWGSVTDLSAGGQDSNSPRVAVSLDGSKATAIWRRSDGGNATIQSASATLSGNSASWGALTDLSTSVQIPSVPQIAVSNDGAKAIAIWTGDFFAQSVVATLSGNVATWSSVTNLSAGIEAIGPHVAISADGTKAVASWDMDMSAGEYIPQTVAATIVGNNASWGSPVNLLTLPRSVNQYTRVAVASDGSKATALWVGRVGGNQIIQTASALLEGTISNWSSSVDVSSPGQDAFFPELALSNDGTRATAVWGHSSGSDYTVQSASSFITGNTATWSSVTDLSGGGLYPSAPPRAGIALSSDGTTATAVWHRVLTLPNSIIKSASALIVYPTPTPTASPTATPTTPPTSTPTATPTVTPTWTSTPLPTATPRGIRSGKVPRPRVRVRVGTITVSIRETIKGLRDFYIFVVDTSSETLFTRRRVNSFNSTGRIHIRNVPAGSYRIYTYVARRGKRAIHSPMQSVVVP